MHTVRYWKIFGTHPEIPELVNQENRWMKGKHIYLNLWRTKLWQNKNKKCHQIYFSFWIIMKWLLRVHPTWLTFILRYSFSIFSALVLFSLSAISHHVLSPSLLKFIHSPSSSIRELFFLFSPSLLSPIQTIFFSIFFQLIISQWWLRW